MNLCIILRLLQQHMEITEMTIIGGLSKGDIVRQIFADIFGTDIIKLDYMDEVSSMGAAVVAGVGVGELGGFQDIDRFLKVNSVNKPVAEHTAAYEKLMPLFDKTYYDLVEVFAEMSK